MPTFLINSRLYYTDTTAADNGTFETGIDMHWKSSYMADGYDPITQQFYLQDEFTVYSYPVIDLFLNFRIKSFSAFLKFSHCNESWLAPASGYFVTPLYPGQKKAFDIGLSWSFFD
jgi:Putative porin